MAVPCGCQQKNVGPSQRMWRHRREPVMVGVCVSEGQAGHALHLHLVWCWNRGMTAKGRHSVSSLTGCLVLPHFSDSSCRRSSVVGGLLLLLLLVLVLVFPSVFPLPRCCSRHFRAAGRPRPLDVCVAAATAATTAASADYTCCCYCCCCC